MRFAPAVVLPLALACAIGALACGNSGKEGSATPEAEQNEAPLSEEGKQWGGWRWKGKREECFFLHDNTCYVTFDAACKAARCKGGRCVADEAAPAKVSCEER
jgi:hypothetical protein